MNDGEHKSPPREGKAGTSTGKGFELKTISFSKNSEVTWSAKTSAV